MKLPDGTARRQRIAPTERSHGDVGGLADDGLYRVATALGVKRTFRERRFERRRHGTRMSRPGVARTLVKKSVQPFDCGQRHAGGMTKRIASVLAGASSRLLLPPDLLLYSARYPKNSPAPLSRLPHDTTENKNTDLESLKKPCVMKRAAN